MLPIENENYGMLYSFQPNYLAQLISDDRNPPNPIDTSAQPSNNIWNSMAEHVRALFK
jgi:hypothetical protein